ncbi:hypothetical protein QTP88_024403 [Uroleucon formosanum]
MFSIFKFNKVKTTINNPPVKNAIQTTSDLDKHADEEYEEDNPSFNSVDSAEEESGREKLIVSTCIDSSDVKTLKLDLGVLDSGPKQPILKNYPKTLFGKQNRSFSDGYFNQYSWLEYSIKIDAVFCFCCRIFNTNNICIADNTFIKTGFRNWKKLSGNGSKLMSHEKSKYLEVYERFLGFMDVSEKQDAQTLVNTIFQFLEHSNLGNIPIFAQSYNGASVMSGKRNGVQSKLLERYPCAIYTHCMAHRINLVVVDMCKNVEYAKSFFNSLEALYVYFSRPSTNKKLKDMQLKMDIKASSITRISDTRWVCRYKNCKAVKDNFEVILEVLREEIDADSNLDVAQAIGIEAMIKKGHFILFLIILEDILTKINILSNLMQEKKATLGKSVNLINSIIKTFENDRCSEKFKTVWTEDIALAKEFNISLEIAAKGSPNVKEKKQQLYKTIMLVILLVLNVLMLMILDCVLSGLRSRFSTESLKIGHSIDNFMKLKYDESLHFIEHYENTLCIDKDQLKAEMLIMKNCINKDNFDIDALDVRTAVLFCQPPPTVD